MKAINMTTSSSLTIILHFAIIISLFAALSQLAFAISISGNKVNLVYAPGKTLELQKNYTLDKELFIEAHLEGNLTQYAKLIDPDPDGPPRIVTVTLNIPADVNQAPGKYALFLVATEKEKEQKIITGNSAKTIMQMSIITVDFPYPGVYIEAILKAQDINVGEKAKFVVDVANRGLENVSIISASVKVLDANNNSVAELASSEPRMLEAVKDTSFEFEWDSAAAGAKPGSYAAIATIDYDGKKLETNKANFKIGTLNVEIKAYTKQFEANAINPFYIDVESGWNDEIKGVYGELYFGNRTFKTISYDLQPWQRTRLTGYADLAGTELGQYPAKFIAYYSDLTTEKSDVVNVSVASKMQREMPVGTGESTGLGAGTIAIIVLGIILVTAVIALFFIYTRRK